MQEFSCSKGEICLDEDKINVSRNYNLKSLFQGASKVDVKRIYPPGSDIVIYQSGAVNKTYSSFVSLCRQQKTGAGLSWNCGIALLEISV